MMKCMIKICDKCGKEVEIDEEKRLKFVEYLVECDIKNDNGLKSLEALKDEYLEEWNNFTK